MSLRGRNTTNMAWARPYIVMAPQKGPQESSPEATGQGGHEWMNGQTFEPMDATPKWGSSNSTGTDSGSSSGQLFNLDKCLRVCAPVTCIF